MTGGVAVGGGGEAKRNNRSRGCSVARWQRTGLRTETREAECDKGTQLRTDRLFDALRLSGLSVAEAPTDEPTKRRGMTEEVATVGSAHERIAC